MTDADRKEWLRAVPTCRVQLEGVVSPLFMAPKVFRTGSVGWYYSGKVVLGDSPCQVNLCVTVIGTKVVVDGTQGESNGAPTRQSESPFEASGSSMPTGKPSVGPTTPPKATKGPKAKNTTPDAS